MSIENRGIPLRRAVPRHLRLGVVRLLLALSAFLGVSYRLALFVTERPAVQADGAIRYVPMAQNLLEGRGSSTSTSAPFEPSRHEVPGYPVFLAAIFAVTGNSLRAVMFAQLLLEVSTIWVAVRIAQVLGLSAFTGRAVLCLGLGCVFLPSMAFSFQAVTLASFTMAVFCLCVLRALRATPASATPWAVAGLAGGVSSMVRVDTYLLVALFAPLLMKALLQIAPARRFVCASAFVLSFSGMLLPWMVRDWFVHGVVQLPGQSQFTYSHMGHGIKAWMDTWADDGQYLQSYVWGPWEKRPDDFPPQSVPDDAERQRAGELFRKAKSDGVDPLAAEVDRGFLELAARARRERPLQTTVLVGLRRALHVWLKLPTGTAMPWGPRALLMAPVYAVWLLILLMAVLGCLQIARIDNGAVLFALILARTAIPLASAWGLANVYLIQAVPAVLILAAAGLSALALEPGDQRLGADPGAGGKRSAGLTSWVLDNRS